jgi:predicted PurR-regulated permease PerM
LITPITLSRQLQLNSLAVLLGLIFWGWLWGPVGMLLAIPILAVFRVVGEHVRGLEPVAEILRG